MGTRLRSFERYHPRPPTASPSPRLGFPLHPKLQSLLSQERVKLRTSNLARTIKRSIPTKAHENFGEMEVWVYPGTAQILWVPPIISGKEKATDFKFGQYIQRVHANKGPLKILEKRERGRIEGLPNFFGYTLLSQEREKQLISNLASTFRGSIRIKAHEKFRRKGSVGVWRDCPNFLGTPYYLRNG